MHSSFKTIALGTGLMEEGPYLNLASNVKIRERQGQSQAGYGVNNLEREFRMNMQSEGLKP